MDVGPLRLDEIQTLSTPQQNTLDPSIPPGFFDVWAPTNQSSSHTSQGPAAQDNFWVNQLIQDPYGVIPQPQFINPQHQVTTAFNPFQYPQTPPHFTYPQIQSPLLPQPAPPPPVNQFFTVNELVLQQNHHTTIQVGDTVNAAPPSITARTSRFPQTSDGATRRSARIKEQERKKGGTTAKKGIAKNRKRNSANPFDMGQLYDVPISMDRAQAILQAVGVPLTTDLKERMEDAVKADIKAAAKGKMQQEEEEATTTTDEEQGTTQGDEEEEVANKIRSILAIKGQGGSSSK